MKEVETFLTRVNDDRLKGVLKPIDPLDHMGPCPRCHLRKMDRFESNGHRGEIIRYVAVGDRFFCKGDAFKAAREKQPDLTEAEFEKGLKLHRGGKGVPQLYVFAAPVSLEQPA